MKVEKCTNIDLKAVNIAYKIFENRRKKGNFMNILFITIGAMDDINAHGIYTDLVRCFRDYGHQVYTVSPYEKRSGLKTKLIEKNGVSMLHVSMGNITKCGLIEKGISTLQFEKRFITAIKKYYSDIKFDLVIYSSPPVTIAKVINYIKKRDGARTYLLLKDIFPQNSVDIGIMSKTGLKGVVYKYFRNKEKRMYVVSDCIGCMSQANKDYVLKHNPEIAPEKVEICPNCIEIRDLSISSEQRASIRAKYSIPQDKKVFVYGGNLGKPQGIPFIIECLKTQVNSESAFFLIVGSGTEYSKLEQFFEEMKPTNMKLMSWVPKEEYDCLIAACDIGMIFLDYRFTIPNFPSRLLSYMEAGLPVFACTDSNTDIGKVVVDGGFGWWCESNDVDKFIDLVEKACGSDTVIMVEKERRYLIDNYNVCEVCNNIQKIV